MPYCRQPQDGQGMHANAYNTCAWPGARRLRYLITDTMCNNAYKCNNKLRKSEAVRPWYYTYSDYTYYYYIILRLLLLLYYGVWFLRYNSMQATYSLLFCFVCLFVSCLLQDFTLASDETHIYFMYTVCFGARVNPFSRLSWQSFVIIQACICL